MNLTDPLTVIAPTIDTRVLQALGATAGASTGRQVHRTIGSGSPEGVRLALQRLVHQGIVTAEPARHAVLYRLNREHIAANAILDLLRVRSRFIDELRQVIGAWPVPAQHSSLFGSFARGEGDSDSDVDVLVVGDPSYPEQAAWQAQLDELSRVIPLRLGNQADVVAIGTSRLREMSDVGDPIVESWRSNLHLTGESFMDLTGRLRTDP